LLEKSAFTEKKELLLEKPAFTEKKKELLLEKSAFTENNLIIAGMVKSTTSLLLVG